MGSEGERIRGKRSEYHGLRHVLAYDFLRKLHPPILRLPRTIGKDAGWKWLVVFDYSYPSINKGKNEESICQKLPGLL